MVRGDRRDYLQRHPAPDDVLLVVEVADASLARDRGVKKQSYAQAGIPIYWIVNLPDRQIEVYTDPTGPSAAPDYGPSDTIIVALDGAGVISLEVRELLP